MKRKSQITGWFWNWLGMGLFAFLCGSGWSIGQAKYYQIQLAQYQLTVGSYLSNVQKASNSLELSAQRSAIAPHEKQKIQQLTKQSDAAIEQVQWQIEAEVDKLTFIEDDI